MAFVALAALVFLGGWFRQTPDGGGKHFRATASVVHEVTPPGDPASTGRAAAESPLSSVENGNFGAEGPAQFQATRSPDGRTVEVTVTCERSDADTAASMADLAAGEYAEHLRRWWGAGRLADYAAARNAAEAAGAVLAEARGKLDAALEAERPRAAPPAPSAGRPTAPPAAEPQSPAGHTGPTTLVDNAEWVELARQLQELQRRREAMLATRTALHPVVREVDHEIQVLQGRIAGTPRFVPSESPSDGVRGGPDSAPSRRESPWPSEPAPVPRSEHAAGETPDRRREPIEPLRAAVAKAEAAQSEAHAGERRAWKALLDEPRIELRPAVTEGVAAGASTAGGGAQLVALAVCSGVLLCAGLLMLSTGAAVAPVVRSVAELESLLGAPVLGPLPVPAGPGHLATVAPARGLSDRAVATAWILGGLAALAIAGGVALRAWGVW